jgi:hypothetical protein
MRNILSKILCVCAASGVLAFVAGCKTDNQSSTSSASAAVQTSAPTAAAVPTPAAPAVTAVNGVIRIKAGSSEPFKDSSGNVWQAEVGFEGGDVIGHDSSLAIANTKDAGLFQSEHYSMDSFSCAVPNGKYLAKLYFAETYDGITGPGQRVFSLNVQGREFKDFDVWVKAGGPNRAYVETVPVEVTDGKFKITFTSNIENPQINAVELIPAALAADVQASAAPAAATAPGVIRIKAGSSEPFKDSSGNVWQAEQGFDGGDMTERDPEMSIANTKDAGLYRSEHYGMNAFSCTVPNGKYIAKLHFAETFDGVSGAGERVFSFNVQGHEFKDFDVFVKAGGSNRAYVETVPVEVTNGKFTITFTSNVENPQINAIELVPQS